MKWFWFGISFLVLSYGIPSQSIGQDKKLDFQVFGVFAHQTDNVYANPSQNGGGVGFGVYKGNKLGKVGFEVDLLALNRPTLKYAKAHTFEGMSFAVKLNFLFKTIAVGRSHLLLGPGIGIYQPLNWDEKFSGRNGYGPNFGVNAKALMPVRISDFPFYLIYNFDFITDKGYIRNSFGVGYKL
jgi:hypothetical protein